MIAVLNTDSGMAILLSLKNILKQQGIRPGLGMVSIMDQLEKKSGDVITDCETRKILAAEVKVYKKAVLGAKTSKDTATEFMENMRKEENNKIFNKKRGIIRSRSSPVSSRERNKDSRVANPELFSPNEHAGKVVSN